LRNGLLRAIVSAADTWRIHLVTVEAFMTPLRQRFIEDLQLRNRSPRTVECYVFHLKKFATHFGVSPDRLGAEQVHRYLLHLLHQQKASWSHYNQAVSALRFFYRVTCPIDNVVSRLPYGKRPKRLMPVCYCGIAVLGAVSWARPRVEIGPDGFVDYGIVGHRSRRWSDIKGSVTVIRVGWPIGVGLRPVVAYPLTDAFKESARIKPVASLAGNDEAVLICGELAIGAGGVGRRSQPMEAGRAERDAIGVNRPADSFGWGKSGTFPVARSILSLRSRRRAKRCT
jgi:hypothetical protein